MKFSFEAGNREKHTVDFHYNQFLGYLKIMVDGKIIARKFHLFSLGTVSKYEFSIGESELHHVVIEKERNLALAGFRKHGYRIFVDGKLIREYEGVLNPASVMLSLGSCYPAEMGKREGEVLSRKRKIKKYFIIILLCTFALLILCCVGLFFYSSHQAKNYRAEERIFFSRILPEYAAKKGAIRYAGEKVLAKINDYKAPQRPKGLLHMLLPPLSSETYDSRISRGAEVPPTIVDTFICDIWMLLHKFVERRQLRNKMISEADIRSVLYYYKYTNSDNLVGYRPWTHKNFIDSLTEPQLNTLAKEAVEYIKKYGVRDVKSEGEKDKYIIYPEK